MHLDEENRGISRTWLSYAESDLSLASTKPEGAILPGTLCFLAQQACEKSLKALLIYCGIQFPRTHNINVLIQLYPTAYKFRKKCLKRLSLQIMLSLLDIPESLNLLPILNTKWLSNQPSSFSNGFLIRL